jgi:hypothetical protein
MTRSQLDHIARTLCVLISRRSLVATSGALLALKRGSTNAASQLQPPSCSAQGAVCTQLLGCCDGLVCATSVINPNYGVCISGEGEQVAVTSQLVVPASDGVMAQLAAELAETATDGATADQAVAAQQSAQDMRRSTHRTRKDAKRSKKRSRRDTHQANKRGETTDTDTDTDTDDTDQ